MIGVIARFFTRLRRFDLNKTYVPYRPTPRNRHERRVEKKEDRTPWSSFWKFIPWYRIDDYYGSACKHYIDTLKLRKGKTSNHK